MTHDDLSVPPPEKDGEPLGPTDAARQSVPQPPPELGDRVTREADASPFVFRRSAEGPWLPSPNASVATRLLYHEPGNRVTTRVVQLATGHTLAPPLLGGVRSIYIVSGAVHGQRMILGEGDFAEEARPVQEWRARRPSTVLELSSSRPDAYGLRVFAASHAIWAPRGTGLRARTLVTELSAGREVTLIRMEAEATLEGHDADGVQELYVLEGSCVIENQALVAGDYHRAAAGARPGPATTSEGCLLFSVARDLRVLPAA